MLREIWNKAYEDKNSESFKKFASALKKSIEDLYHEKSENQGSILANLVEAR